MKKTANPIHLIAALLATQGSIDRNRPNNANPLPRDDAAHIEKANQKRLRKQSKAWWQVN